MNPPPPEGQKIFLNFLMTFLVVIIQQVHLRGPLYLALSGVTLLYAHIRPFTTIWGPFTP